jgi:hypothetical protein
MNCDVAFKAAARPNETRFRLNRNGDCRILGLDDWVLGQTRTTWSNKNNKSRPIVAGQETRRRATKLLPLLKQPIRARPKSVSHQPSLAKAIPGLGGRARCSSSGPKAAVGSQLAG